LNQFSSPGHLLYISFSWPATHHRPSLFSFIAHSPLADLPFSFSSACYSLLSPLVHQPDLSRPAPPHPTDTLPESKPSMTQPSYFPYPEQTQTHLRPPHNTGRLHLARQLSTWISPSHTRSTPTHRDIQQLQDSEVFPNQRPNPLNPK
jgi:hypothetical protein